jgi:branched-chain amino acid transport system substrate-binding protein
MGSLRLLMVGVLGLATIAASPSLAQRNYDPGASDSEIKIGNIMPYSGPISSYSVIGKTEAAYFEKINAEGGINGRKIKFISYDDSSNPAKTVEQARKLVEGDEVLLIFQSLGGSMNIAIEKYLNDRKVPQLFVSAPNKRFGDP